MIKKENLLKKHTLLLVLCIVFGTSLFFRFINYDNRWSLASDQARDALIAREAVERKELPLRGPFSSAGPYQMNGVWYWPAMIATAAFPLSVTAPWVFLTFLYCFFITIFSWQLSKLYSPFFGLIAGLLFSVSTANVSQSVNLTNPSFLIITSISLLIVALWYLRFPRKRGAFLLGFFFTLGATIHTQGTLLMLLVISVLLFHRKLYSFIHVLMAIIGSIVAALPMILFDYKYQFSNFQKFFQYLLFSNSQVTYEELGRRWLTFLGVFIPQELSHIVGGQTLWFVVLLAITIVGLLLPRKKDLVYLRRDAFFLLLMLLGMIGVTRYIKAPIYSAYLIVFHPLVIFITAFALYRVFRFNRHIGIACIAITLILTVNNTVVDIINAENFTAKVTQEWVSTLTSQYPYSRFAIYDRHFSHTDKSLPLTLFLDAQQKTSEDGLRVGLVIHPGNLVSIFPTIEGSPGGYMLMNISSSSSAELADLKWGPVDKSVLYDSMQYWKENE